MLNVLTISGRLAADPELRRTSNGVAVTTIRIACTRDYTPQGMERQTDWFDVVAWKNTAEFIVRNLTKGRMVTIKGRLESREWTDKNGNKRTTIEIVAENVYFADSRKEGQAPGTSGDAFEHSQLHTYNEEDPDPLAEDDELPF